jgi:transcriptional regulator with XRE-family HTH domain
MKIETIRDVRREALKKDPARAAGEAVLVRLATRLYLLRTSLELTQEQLADRSGLDQANISDIENGDANPTARTLGRIASGLGVDAAALFGRDPIGVRFGSTVSLYDAIKWRGPTTHTIEQRAALAKRKRMTKPVVPQHSKANWMSPRYGALKEGAVIQNEQLVSKAI